MRRLQLKLLRKRPVSSGTGYESIDLFEGFGVVSPVSVTHEPRASFLPIRRAGRRALAAGLDRQELAESHERTRRGVPRRRERLFVDQRFE